MNNSGAAVFGDKVINWAEPQEPVKMHTYNVFCWSSSLLFMLNNIIPCTLEILEQNFSQGEVFS